jgi:predicted nucleotidyltransferase
MVINKNISRNAELINFSLREKILKLLIENKKPFTILQIAESLKVDYKNTFMAVDKLYPDLVYKNKVGNANIIEIKLAPNNDIYSVEEKRTKQFLQENKSLILIKKDIESLNYPFLIVLIFGSYAKKINTINSDIDICIISDNELKTKELISKFHLLPLKLEIQDFNFKEFESMIEKKQKNLSSEIIKNNIILYGVDNYYNLISKWMKKD